MHLGWNNNVAVKIVACWNRNVFTSSSWLDRHGEFVSTIHVRRDRMLIRVDWTLDFQKYVKYLKYIREFHTPVCYCGDISTLRNVPLNETNCDWLFDMSVKQPHGRALINECSHIFQSFSRQSEGLATRDYPSGNLPLPLLKPTRKWLKLQFIKAGLESGSKRELVA